MRNQRMNKAAITKRLAAMEHKDQAKVESLEAIFYYWQGEQDSKNIIAAIVTAYKNTSKGKEPIYSKSFKTEAAAKAFINEQMAHANKVNSQGPKGIFLLPNNHREAAQTDEKITAAYDKGTVVYRFDKYDKAKEFLDKELGAKND